MTVSAMDLAASIRKEFKNYNAEVTKEYLIIKDPNGHMVLAHNLLEDAERHPDDKYFAVNNWIEQMREVLHG